MKSQYFFDGNSAQIFHTLYIEGTWINWEVIGLRAHAIRRGSNCGRAETGPAGYPDMYRLHIRGKYTGRYFVIHTPYFSVLNFAQQYIELNFKISKIKYIYIF
jgi:hypothetical protein